MGTLLQNGALNKGSASPSGAQLNALAAFAVWTEIAGAAGTDQATAWLKTRYLRTGASRHSARTSESALVTVNPEKGSPVYASPMTVAGSNPSRWDTTEELSQRARLISSGFAGQHCSRLNRHHSAR